MEILEREIDLFDICVVLGECIRRLGEERVTQSGRDMLVANKPCQVEVRRRRPILLRRDGSFGQRLRKRIGYGLNRVGSLIPFGGEMREAVGERPTWTFPLAAP